MRCTIERDPFLRVLTALARVAERKSTIPILSNVRIELAGETLRLKATDHDIELSDTVPADIDADGETTVAAAPLLALLKNAPAGSQVAIEATKDRCTIKCGRSRSTLPTLPAEDFPAMIVSKNGTGFPVSFTLPARDLRGLFERVEHAQSKEETRYYLNGVCLDVHEGRLFAVATDGHRLSRTSMPTPEGAGELPTLIVPSKTVAELLKLLDVAGDVTVEASTFRIRFTVGSTVLMSALVDGTYPDYRRVIPTDNRILVSLKPADLATSVARVSAVGSKKGSAVKLELASDMATLSTNSPDVGTSVDEIDIALELDQDGAMPAPFGFAAGYLGTLAGHLRGEMATLHLRDPAAPLLVTDGGDESSVYVLMPMRVS